MSSERAHCEAVMEDMFGHWYIARSGYGYVQSIVQCLPKNFGNYIAWRDFECNRRALYAIVEGGFYIIPFAMVGFRPAQIVVRLPL